jgi:hypothetical protein
MLGMRVLAALHRAGSAGVDGALPTLVPPRPPLAAILSPLS